MWDLTPFLMADDNRMTWDISWYIYKLYIDRRSTILSCLGFVDWLQSQVWAMDRHPRQLELKWINIIPKETIMHNRSKTGGILYIQSYLLLKFAHLLRDQTKLCLWKTQSIIGKILEKAKTFDVQLWDVLAQCKYQIVANSLILQDASVNSIASRRRIAKVRQLMNIQQIKVDSEMLKKSNIIQIFLRWHPINNETKTATFVQN